MYVCIICITRIKGGKQSRAKKVFTRDTTQPDLYIIINKNQNKRGKQRQRGTERR